MDNEGGGEEELKSEKLIYQCKLDVKVQFG